MRNEEPEPEPCSWKNSEASIDSLQFRIQFRYIPPAWLRDKCNCDQSKNASTHNAYTTVVTGISKGAH